MTGPCAIVGGGLVGFTAYAALRRAGLQPHEIVVFGGDPDPASAFRVRAGAIRQRLMRSESDGHCAPTTFPGLAVRSASRRRSAWPLLLSVCDRYHPTVDEFLDHVSELRTRTRWDESIRRRYIGRIRAVAGGFELDSEGVFRHVLVAPGHPALAMPPEVRRNPWAVHAYAPHGYASRVAIVGAGMAAATEWLNALAAGSSVVSVRRREPERRTLNLPRTFFTRRGLTAFHRASATERISVLRRYGAPSYPPGRYWDDPLAEAEREGRFTVAGELDGEEQVICATGFLRGFRHSPLLSRLVDDHGLATAKEWVVLDADATVPGLTDDTRTLALAGAPGQWAFPAADTLAGGRYAAHGFTRRVQAWRTR